MINSNLPKRLKGITNYAQLNDLPNWTGYLIACHQDNTPPPLPSQTIYTLATRGFRKSHLSVNFGKEP